MGVFSLGNAAATAVTSEFDWFTLTTPGGGGGGAGDEFDGTSLDKTRWNAIQREDTSLYSVGSGGLTMTMVQADVGGANNRNYILQTADHTSPDYVLETKLSAWTFVGQYRQAGILIYQDDANFIKFNAISDATNTRINRMEIRSRTGGTTADGPNLDVPTGVTGIWLRLTKSGTSYQAEASFNGTTWQNVGAPVTNVDAGHEVRPLHGRCGRRGRHGDLRLLQGQRVDRLRRRHQHGAGDHRGDGDARLRASLRCATSFSAAATDANGDALTYAWDFDGNGSTDATGATAIDHVHHRRQPHGEADRVRRQGRHRHPGHPGPGAGRGRPVEEAAGARVLQDRGLPARLDPGRHHGDARRWRVRRTGRSIRPRTARCSRPTCSRTTTW